MEVSLWLLMEFELQQKHVGTLHLTALSFFDCAACIHETGVVPNMSVCHLIQPGPEYSRKLTGRPAVMDLVVFLNYFCCSNSTA